MAGNDFVLDDYHSHDGNWQVVDSHYEALCEVDDDLHDDVKEDCMLSGEE